MILCPDTNFFLQCRDATELPWRTLGTDGIELVVNRTVQKEVDGLKQAGQGRRTKRARAATATFRRILDSPDDEVVVRDSDLRVVLTLAPPLDPARQWPDMLDRALADDRIIEETLALSSVRGEPARLLTNDTNAVLTARACKVPVLLVPEDWLLGPEPDERDRAITKLAERVRALEQDAPVIRLVAQDGDGRPLQRSQLEWVRFPALDDALVAHLVSEAVAANPVRTDFSGSAEPPRAASAQARFSALGHLTGRWRAPTEDEISAYTNEAYPAWQNKLEAFLRSLPGQLASRASRTGFTVVLGNDGHRPADGLVIEVETEGALSLLPPVSIVEDNAVEDLTAPRPPLPPAGRYTSSFDHLTRATAMFRETPPLLHSHLRPPEHDKHAFYYHPERPRMRTKAWRLDCDQFRHQVENHSFDLRIAPDNEGAAESRGVVRVTITASNLAKPEVLRVPVIITTIDADVEREARLKIGSIPRVG